MYFMGYICISNVSIVEYRESKCMLGGNKYTHYLLTPLHTIGNGENEFVCSRYSAERLIWKDISKSCPLEIKRCSFSCSLPFLSLSACLRLPASLTLYSQKDVDKSLTCLPFSFFLFLFPPLSLLIPLFFRATVQHSDWIWWICDGACLPTLEYQAAGRGEPCQRKKMTCGTGRHA